VSIIRSNTKIRTDIRIRVEAILRDYPDLETYINNRKQELMIPHREIDGCKSKFTHKEVVLIDSRFVPFMEEVEDDE